MSILTIPFNDIQREPDEIVNAQLQAMEDVLRSGWWVLGTKIQAFEHAWAEACKTRSAVGAANGMDAIEIGLWALGIGLGDEVITTPVAAFTTTLAIQRCGAIPDYADIDPATACLDYLSVERCISSRTWAVLEVHLYGRAADLDNLEEICSKYAIDLVEDCAQTHGALHHGRPVGSVGSFGTWSFYPTKNLVCIGDAGALTTDNSDLVATSMQLRNYGQVDRYRHNLAGMNSRLDEVQAAILMRRLQHAQVWSQRRISIAERYWSEITTPHLVTLSQPVDPLSHVHHLFVVRTNGVECKSLQDQLIANGVTTLIRYPVVCHDQGAVGDHRIDPCGLSPAVDHSQSCFSLPIHPFLSSDEVDLVISCCNSLSIS